MATTIMYRFPKSRYPYNRYTLAEVREDWTMAKEEGWLDDSPHNISFDWYMFWAQKNGVIVAEEIDMSRHVNTRNI